MNLPFQIENKLDKFLKPKIGFTTIYNQYLYNDCWLAEITKETLRKESLEILELVNDHLIAGLNTKTYLKELRQMVLIKLDWYRENSIKELVFIENAITKIHKIDYCHINAPEDVKYAINDIIEGKESVIDLIQEEESYYYDLYRFRKEFNNFTDPIDIENVKLNYVLDLHYESVSSIYRYIDCILEDYERINFEKFDFEKLLINFEFMVPKNTIDFSKKCNITLNKIDVANLFYFLMEEQLFVFDKNEAQNKVSFQRFIEQNFTYKDDDDLQKNISRINKEFSKIGYANKSSHFAFINFLINKLEERKLRFK